MRKDAQYILEAALRDAMPGEAVERALSQLHMEGGAVVLVSVGKAAWEMAAAASRRLGERICRGIVITKYGHVRGAIPPLEMYEAGHPVPDENGFCATARALQLVNGLTEADHVLFLLSGGGSALFEKPYVSGAEMRDVTRQLLACGASIVEMNTVRKRLSAVKGGRFAQACLPAQVHTVVLSDVIGDPLDMIASGPAYADSSTCAQAQEIAARYRLELSPRAMECLRHETPKQLPHVETLVTGSVRQLCLSGARACRELGYEPIVLTASLDCEAREAGAFLAAIARDHQHEQRSLAFLAGGETVVHLSGKGLGGRNQELALSAARGIETCKSTCVFSFGSDGTDGPTDAAGGYVDENTMRSLSRVGLDVRTALTENDAYHALQAVDGLLMTGPTGTNVNDLSVVLIRR